MKAPLSNQGGFFIVMKEKEMKIKYTRKQYIIDKECDHRTYWGQFVTEWVKKLVLQHIPKEELMASQDPHFNDIPMQRWDQMHAWVPQHVKRAIAESNATMDATETRGRYYSLSDMTCLLKEAARQIVEREAGLHEEVNNG